MRGLGAGRERERERGPLEERRDGGWGVFFYARGGAVEVYCKD